MKTIQDMRAEVIRTLEEGTPEGVDGYHVDKIIQELYAAAGDSWDMGNVGHDAFWDIVISNAKSEPVNGDVLLSALIHFYAQRRNGRHSVPGSEVLIQAWQLVHGGTEEEADTAVGELLQEIYANAA